MTNHVIVPMRYNYNITMIEGFLCNVIFRPFSPIFFIHLVKEIGLWMHQVSEVPHNIM